MSHLGADDLDEPEHRREENDREETGSNHVGVASLSCHPALTSTIRASIVTIAVSWTQRTTRSADPMHGPGAIVRDVRRFAIGLAGLLAAFTMLWASWTPWRTVYSRGPVFPIVTVNATHDLVGLLTMPLGLALLVVSLIFLAGRLSPVALGASELAVGSLTTFACLVYLVHFANDDRRYATHPHLGALQHIRYGAKVEFATGVALVAIGVLTMITARNQRGPQPGSRSDIPATPAVT